VKNRPSKTDALTRRPDRTTLRRLLALSRPETRPLLLGSLFLLLGSTMGLAYPQAIRLIIDEALGARSFQLIDRAALAMVAIFAVQGVAIALRYYLFITAGERIVTRLRRDLFSSLVSQEIAFFDQHKTGELTNRLSSDTAVLQSSVSSNISMALRNAVQAVGGVALLFYTSPRLALVMLAIVPAVAIGAVTYGRRVRKLSKQVQDALATSNEVAEESLSGIRTVRAFSAERTESGRYAEAVDHAYELARQRSVQSATFMGIASFAAYVSAAAVLWYGGRMVVTGALTVGGLTSFLVYSMLVAFSFGGLADSWADLMRAAGAAERVFELMGRTPAIASGGETLAHVAGRLELQGLRFAYPSRPDVDVLKGLDLTLNPGEVIALVGPSGTGKSTIAALLARLYDPQEGRLLLDGHDLRTLDPEWLRLQIGAVAQEPLLFSSTIADNIRYGRLDATDDQVEAAARAAHAHEFISRFPEGYATRVGERGVQLSGGQKQRVAIARAVLKDPRILVLDEATSALDAESEHLVQDALDRLMKGRTTLIIAHRLSTVRGADRVLVLEGGQVVQSGSHQALMAEEGLYRRLVERQFVSA